LFRPTLDWFFINPWGTTYDLTGPRLVFGAYAAHSITIVMCLVANLTTNLRCATVFTKKLAP
jgi:hypothetical protein